VSIKPALCFCLLACAVPARSAAAPEGLLAAALGPPAAAYEGEVSVLIVREGKETRREVLLSFSPPGRYRREILDRYGFTVFTILSDGVTEWVYDRRRGTAYRGEPADPDYKLLDPEEELALITENYEVRPAGRDRVAGTPCAVLEVFKRRSGELVRSLCREDRYGVVLRRRAFGPDGALSSEFRFIRLKLGAALDDARFRFSPPAGIQVVENRLKPDYMELEDAALATAMRPRAPSWLPPGFVFESMNILPYKGATLLHFRFSDGVDVLSMFQAPSRTRLEFTPQGVDGPARELDIPGGKGRVALWAGGKILEWAAGDRFVLMGRLELDALVRMAVSVPAGGSP